MSVTFDRSVGFSGNGGFLLQKKTDRHDITEILLKVAVNTIKQKTSSSWQYFNISTAVAHSWEYLNIQTFVAGLDTFPFRFKIVAISSTTAIVEFLTSSTKNIVIVSWNACHTWSYLLWKKTIWKEKFIDVFRVSILSPFL